MLLLLDLSTLTSLVSLLFGSSTILTYLLYRKQQKRLRNAEAFSKEVEALKSTIETLKNTINSMEQQMQYYEGRLTEMQKLIVGKDSYITQIYQDKHMLEIKNAKNETAINKAYGCSCRSDSYKCPVLMQHSANEEAFVKILAANNRKEKNN